MTTTAQRNPALPRNGVDRLPVALSQISGVEEDRVPLPNELVDKNVTGAKDSAVLVGSVLRLEHQGLPKTISLQCEERALRVDPSRRRCSCRTQEVPPPSGAWGRLGECQRSGRQPATTAEAGQCRLSMRMEQNRGLIGGKRR